MSGSTATYAVGSLNDLGASNTADAAGTTYNGGHTPMTSEHVISKDPLVVYTVCCRRNCVTVAARRLGHLGDQAIAGWSAPPTTSRGRGDLAAELIAKHYGVDVTVLEAGGSPVVVPNPTRVT